MKTDDELLAEAQALDKAYDEAFPDSGPNPDAGTTGTGAAEAFNLDLLALVKQARAVVSGHRSWDALQVSIDRLTEALDQFEPWLENDENDYVGMGWVDDRGRP